MTKPGRHPRIGVQAALEYRPYREVLATLWAPDRARFDEDAGAAYLSVDLPGTAADLFVSYEDEAACTRKMEYVRANDLGGVILWDVADQYFPDRARGARNPPSERSDTPRSPNTGAR